MTRKLKYYCVGIMKVTTVNLIFNTELIKFNGIISFNLS